MAYSRILDLTTPYCDTINSTENYVTTVEVAKVDDFDNAREFEDVMLSNHILISTVQSSALLVIIGNSLELFDDFFDELFKFIEEENKRNGKRYESPQYHVLHKGEYEDKHDHKTEMNSWCVTMDLKKYTGSLVKKVNELCKINYCSYYIKMVNLYTFRAEGIKQSLSIVQEVQTDFEISPMMVNLGLVTDEYYRWFLDIFYSVGDEYGDVETIEYSEWEWFQFDVNERKFVHITASEAREWAEMEEHPKNEVVGYFEKEGEYCYFFKVVTCGAFVSPYLPSETREAGEDYSKHCNGKMPLSMMPYYEQVVKCETVR